MPLTQRADRFCELLSLVYIKPSLLTVIRKYTLTGLSGDSGDCTLDYILTAQNFMRYQLKVKKEMYILKMAALIGLSHIYLLNTYTVPDATEHQ